MRKLSISNIGCIVLACCAAALSSPAQTFTTLVNFNGSNGASPAAGLVQATDGNFYGTTEGGGAYGSGTVFKLTPGGTLTTLYSFCPQKNVVQLCTDGLAPAGRLVQATDGNFYGTTAAGGTSTSCSLGCGTIFEVTPTGTLTILHIFDGTDGGGGSGLIQATDGNFYGVTGSGGATGDGAIFQITPQGKFTILHSFKGYPEGAQPIGALIQATDGNFYGTTANGGTTSLTNTCFPLGGCGTVFKITPGGTLTTLYSFSGMDGLNPVGALVQGSDGNFYGTTSFGGANEACGMNGCGTVFEITPGGIFTSLHSFGATDGQRPTAGLIQANDGSFYGTTIYGGAISVAACSTTGTCGTIFKITAAGALTTLHSFNFTDGYEPIDGLIQATDGNLYGTTGLGGSGGGTVFTVTLAPIALQVVTTGIPSVGSAQAYSVTLAAVGGSGTGYTWLVSSGSLPAGFALSPSGVLSSPGTPAALVDSYDFVVQVTDSARNAAVQPLTLVILCAASVNLSLGDPSTSGLLTSLTATFIPPNSMSVQDYAVACGFTGFNWIQTIRKEPDPSGVYAQSNPSVPLVPPWPDPPDGAYTYDFLCQPATLLPECDPYPGLREQWLSLYLPGFEHTGGYYYNVSDLSTGCAEGYMPVNQQLTPGCRLPIMSNPSTLNLWDLPKNSSCKPTEHCIVLETQLVGVCGAVSPTCNSTGPSGPLYRWTWYTNFNGSTEGGVFDNGPTNVFPPDSGSGTGGITVTSINGVPVPIVTVTPSSASVTTAQTLSVTVAVSGGSGKPIATGSIILASGTYTSAATTLANGSATTDVPAGSLATGADALTAHYAPDSASASTYTKASGSASVMVQDFTLAVASGSSSSQTVSPGQTATYSLSLGSEGGFNQTVAFTCIGVPSESTCEVSPSSRAPGGNITITITTAAPSVGAIRTLPQFGPRLPDPQSLLMLAILIAGLAWTVRGWRKVGAGRARTELVPLAAGLLVALALAGCGGGGGGGNSSNHGTPTGTYNLTVTGMVGSGSTALSHSVPLILKVS